MGTQLFRRIGSLAVSAVTAFDLTGHGAGLAVAQTKPPEPDLRPFMGTLSKNVPINNIKISGRSISFDWTDPDGDNDRWRLELTGKNAGQIVWVDLPDDLKFQPIPVSKNVPHPDKP